MMAYKENLPENLKCELQLFESTAFNFSYRFIKDAKVRHEYVKAIGKSSREIADAYRNGSYNAEYAAELANSQRNLIMDLMRHKSSQLGKSAAFNIKAKGRGIDWLKNKYAQNRFAKQFNALSLPEKNTVHMEIVEKSGVASIQETNKAKLFGKAGKALAYFSMALIVYDIYQSKNKTKAILYNGALIAGGATGSTLTGVASGMACGPGAPACMAIGIFLGGILGTMSTSTALSHTELSKY
jgi:hypothetical protein